MKQVAKSLGYLLLGYLLAGLGQLAHSASDFNSHCTSVSTCRTAVEWQHKEWKKSEAQVATLIAHPTRATLICSIFTYEHLPQDCATAVKRSYCENSDPNDGLDVTPGAGHDHVSLFQDSDVFLSDNMLGIPNTAPARYKLYRNLWVADPVLNVLAAAIVVRQDGGWGQWRASDACTYR